MQVGKATDSIAQLVTSSDPTYYFGMLRENADFNGDGAVDSGDFTLWRRYNGITSEAIQAQGDANGDGMVNGG